MKKTKLIFTVLISFVIILLSGCLPSSYYEDWEEYEGYAVTSTVTNARTDDTTVKLEEFVVTSDIPDGKSIAVLYKHVLGSSKNPYCRVTISELTTDTTTNTVDDYVPTDYKTFDITKNVKVVYEGIMLYVDDDYCYVINDLYRYGYRDCYGSMKKATYHVEVSINGMVNLHFYMNHTETNHPLSKR